ncbi:cytochrome c oxidase subunit 2A [Litchfieldia alkalitelluris]|uniref:cytochrome c oxidase subunit 2A n=1 Tax=Litchfieldia alkalitelluris TaxID=304268 RepID=UPI0009966CB8|nr:cytochrome c oxidase subunit 2A [Litchfieldia alkalitelluris]
MPKVEVNQVKKLKSKVEDRSSLKGTLASVFLLGFFLIVTWVGVYFLFLDRL